MLSLLLLIIPATHAILFSHPGVLVGAADLASARARLSARGEPTFSFFARALASPAGQLTYKPVGPPANGTISCGYYDMPQIGCLDEDNDISAAYTQALLFAIGRNLSHAGAARATLSLYSAGLKRYTNNTEGTCCGNEALQAAWQSAKMTRVAELLRHTDGSGWTSADTAAFNQLMYNVHLPLLYNGTPANGNWMASFIEGMLGIAVFSENATLFAHAAQAWADRMPSYWYVTADGPQPPPNPQPNCDPQPYCEWYNQTIFNSSVSGVCQETCRDMGHMQMGLAAFVNGAATAELQGVPLFSQHAPRLLAASEFAATLQLAEAPPAVPPALLCSGAPVSLKLMPTLEVAHSYFSRLGLQDAATQRQLVTNVRPSANPVGSQMSLWETLSHGLPI
jgi:hypothetical protein